MSANMKAVLERIQQTKEPSLRLHELSDDDVVRFMDEYAAAVARGWNKNQLAEHLGFRPNDVAQLRADWKAALVHEMASDSTYAGFDEKQLGKLASAEIGRLKNVPKGRKRQTISLGDGARQRLAAARSKWAMQIASPDDSDDSDN